MTLCMGSKVLGGAPLRCSPERDELSKLRERGLLPAVQPSIFSDELTDLFLDFIDIFWSRYQVLRICPERYLYTIPVQTWSRKDFISRV